MSRPKTKADPTPKPLRHAWFCCEESAPCEVHVSTSDRMVYLTSKDLRDAIRVRAAQQGEAPKDVIMKALNAYLGRAEALPS